MNFSVAVEEVKKGKAMRLPEWKHDVKVKSMLVNGKSFIGDTTLNHSIHCLYVDSRYGQLVWYPTEEERKSLKWEVIND